MSEVYNNTNSVNYFKVNDTDENIINNFNIVNLFGKEQLENIQEKVSKATGLAFVTVDYKGDPVTKMTGFTEFCNEVRRNDELPCFCKSSDAFGAIQAAVTKKNSVYFCPCGLLEIAIPIIVRGHFLGGFIGGQVRCLDAPKEISQLSNVMKYSKDYKEDKKVLQLFDKIPLYKYGDFIHVAELISLIINQLGENEFNTLMESKEEKEVVDLNINDNSFDLDNLFSIIKEKDFRRVYYETPKILQNIYESKDRNIESFKESIIEIGQQLINFMEIPQNYAENVEEIFPLNKFLIKDKIYLEFWIFNIMNYIFQKNSIKKYMIFENVFDYIENHIEEEIGLKEITNNCSVSQGYLSRIFKKQFNISIMEYLHMRKITIAKSYFCFSDLSITDVAFKLGYNESSYFSKVFKKYENVTVNKYKNKNLTSMVVIQR